MKRYLSFTSSCMLMNGWTAIKRGTFCTFLRFSSLAHILTVLQKQRNVFPASSPSSVVPSTITQLWRPASSHQISQAETSWLARKRTETRSCLQRHCPITRSSVCRQVRFHISSCTVINYYTKGPRTKRRGLVSEKENAPVYSIHRRSFNHPVACILLVQYHIDFKTQLPSVVITKLFHWSLF